MVKREVGTTSSIEKSQRAIIILGGGLTEQFELNEHTKQRFDTALALLDSFEMIICSSDKSYRKLDKIRHTSEARVGRDYMVEKGIDSEKIYLEEKSRDTISNAYYCRKDLIEHLGVTDITVVTSAFHMPKTMFVFKLVFPQPEFSLTFIQSPNGNVNKEQLHNREISEKIILEFYENILLEKYNISPGDLKTIGKYITEHNPSFIGKKDELHEQLTKKIKETIKGKDPLY